MHAALPSRLLALCQIRAPEDAAHTADGDICGAAHDADYDVGVAHGSDSRHSVEGNNSKVTPRKLRKTRQLRMRLETSALLTTRTGTKKPRRTGEKNCTFK